MLTLQTSMEKTHKLWQGEMSKSGINLQI